MEESGRNPWMESLEIQQRKEVDGLNSRSIAGSLHIFAPMVRYARSSFGAGSSGEIKTVGGIL